MVQKDDVWDSAIEEIMRREAFSREDLEVDAADEVVEETLQQMEELGWLEQEGTLYFAGEKAERMR